MKLPVSQCVGQKGAAEKENGRWASSEHTLQRQGSSKGSGINKILVKKGSN